MLFYPPADPFQMVINIISIRKVEVGESTYPPAVVAMLVLSICQMFWLLSYFIMSGKGALWKASTAAATMLFWACFNFGELDESRGRSARLLHICPSRRTETECTLNSHSSFICTGGVTRFDSFCFALSGSWALTDGATRCNRRCHRSAIPQPLLWRLQHHQV